MNHIYDAVLNISSLTSADFIITDFGNTQHNPKTHLELSVAYTRSIYRGYPIRGLSDPTY